MSSETVRVVVRCRPLNKKEKDRKCKNIINIDKELGQVTITKPEDVHHKKSFTYDSVYDTTAAQRDIYDEVAFPLVDSVLEGYNGTIFAYGQTGCGKTWTMEGKMNPPQYQGIVPNAFRHIFDTIATCERKDTQYLVRCAYLEIYNEQVRDLLGVDTKARLDLKEDRDHGVRVVGLSEHIVQDANAVYDLMRIGNESRTVAFTEMNADSSRSHSIFILNIETSVPDDVSGGRKIKAGKLNLVDLAGSERQSKTHATGIRLQEAAKINLSLSALGNVISALVLGKDKNKHIPYRDSKLTRLLQDSLGGNTKTIMIAAISPADYNYDETLSTLRYANRAKNIKNKPKINEDPKDALLRQYQDEIAKLKAQLEKTLNNKTTTSSTNIIDEVELNKSSTYESERLRKEKEEAEKAAKALEENIEHDRLEKQKLMKELASKEQETEQLRLQREEREKILQNRLTEERKKAQELSKEIEKHSALQDKIKELESKVVTSDKLHNLETEHAKVQDELQKTALKLKKQKKRKQMLEAKRKKAVEAKREIEQHYSNLKEEVQGTRDKLELVEDQYKSALEDIEDLQYEFEEERQRYLGDIRNLDKTATLYKKLLQIFLSSGEIERAVALSRFDKERDNWILPDVRITGTQKVQINAYSGKHRNEVKHTRRKLLSGTKSSGRTTRLKVTNPPSSPPARLVPVDGNRSISSLSYNGERSKTPINSPLDKSPLGLSPSSPHSNSPIDEWRDIINSSRNSMSPSFAQKPKWESLPLTESNNNKSQNHNSNNNKAVAVTQNSEVINDTSSSSLSSLSKLDNNTLCENNSKSFDVHSLLKPAFDIGNKVESPAEKVESLLAKLPEL